MGMAGRGAEQGAREISRNAVVPQREIGNTTAEDDCLEIKGIHRVGEDFAEDPAALFKELRCRRFTLFQARINFGER